MAEAERTIDLRVRPRLDAVVVRPGDTLIVRVNPPLALVVADELKHGLMELLPGIEPVIIAAEQLLVYRPDSDGDE